MQKLNQIKNNRYEGNYVEVKCKGNAKFEWIHKSVYDSK